MVKLRRLIHADKVPIYLLDPELLKEAAKYLDWRREWKEQLIYITGIVHDNFRIPTKILKFETFNDPTFVMDEPISSMRTLAEDSHLLLMVFHSHPQLIPFPSDLDWQTQLNLERIYDTIGGILGLNGYIRFFSGKPFKIHVCGKGIEEVWENLYYRIL
jgi:hypothetical protein